MKYIIGIDQSTQGTKAVLFDEVGAIVKRIDYKHKQIVNEKGWISHDLEEIYENLLKAVRDTIQTAGISKEDIAAVGISNQRETTAAWDMEGKPIGNAIVWQCARAEKITLRLNAHAKEIYEKTGLPLSPYFPASKMAWLIENIIQTDQFHLGTIDAWLVYKLTGKESFRTDYSNASRTQLFNLHTLTWDEKLCKIFGIPQFALPEVCDSNACFGYTDFEGFLEQKVPIHSVLGDSHGALFGQGCHTPGMVKTTYGTGSSIMMNTGERFIKSKTGLAASLAWGIDKKVEYVLEGNINYTGAVVSWLCDDMQLLTEAKEVEEVIASANQEDKSVLVPAFSGLSAPYWRGDVKAMLYGMTRMTGRSEFVKAGVESIAYQITDILKSMEEDSGEQIRELRVDGGPTRNQYLMQFQSDIAETQVCVAENEELSAIGTAYLAGISVGIYDREKVFCSLSYNRYNSLMCEEKREEKYSAWKQAVAMVLTAGEMGERH